MTVTPDGFLTLGFLGRALRFLPGEQPDVFRAEDVTSYPIGGVRFTRDGQRATRMDTLVIVFERVGPLYQPPTLAMLGASGVVIAFGTSHGARVRSGRTLPYTRAQRLAGWLKVAAALTWIASAAAISIFAAGAAGDLSELMFSWPTWSDPALLDDRAYRHGVRRPVSARRLSRGRPPGAVALARAALHDRDADLCCAWRTAWDVRRPPSVVT